MNDYAFQWIHEEISRCLSKSERHTMDVESLHQVFDLEPGWYSELIQYLQQTGSPFECSKVGYSTAADLDPHGQIAFSRRSE